MQISTVPGTPRKLRSHGGVPLLVLICAVTTGCAAAVGAALAAQEIRQGLAGVQQLVASSRSLVGSEVSLPSELVTPLAGTYRGIQVLGTDTVQYYFRTVSRPTAPILDESGTVTGYVLAGIAASTLATLEARVGERATAGEGETGGNALFLVEGTQPPDSNARSLYPAAYLGRVEAGESPAADEQQAELEALGIAMDAPDLDQLVGRGIPHELFSSVAEGVFTLTPEGEAAYQQEYQADDGRTLVLRFERISETTLPEPDWLPADEMRPVDRG